MKEKQTAYFISDLHLGLGSEKNDRVKEDLLIKIFNTFSDNSILFIVGDLFDYWFEYRQAIQKGFYKTFYGLNKLIERGVKVYYIIGNHDFMHRNYFSDVIGVELIEQSITINLDGKIFFLAHGDGLVKNDLGYKILKKVLRNKFFQNLYSLIHPDIGISLASSTSKKSRNYTSKKDYGTLDSLEETAKEYIDKFGYDYVIFGHSHKRKIIEYKNSFYVNLGSWIEQPCYGIYSENKFEIMDW